MVNNDSSVPRILKFSISSENPSLGSYSQTHNQKMEVHVVKIIQGYGKEVAMP